MKTGADLDPGAFAYVCSKTSPVLHIDPDCAPASRASVRRVVDPERHPNNVVCKVCDPDHHIDHSHQGPRDTCRECGAHLNTFGECDFCLKFDAVMAD